MRMQNVLSFDDVAGTITVEGGATYTTINDYLKDKQWAVKNLATLPHFTVVRCCGASHLGPVWTRRPLGSGRTGEAPRRRGG